MYKPIEHSSKYYFHEDTYVNMQKLHKYFKFISTSAYKTLWCLIYLQTKMVAHHSTDAKDSYVRYLWISKVGVSSHFYILINFMVITNVYVRHFIDMEVSSIIFLWFHVKEHQNEKMHHRFLIMICDNTWFFIQMCKDVTILHQQQLSD